MKTEELYRELDSSYSEVLQRLQKESFIARLLKLFLRDTSMTQLGDAIASCNAEEAFRAVHTLKGVSLNLGLKPLADASIELTELLRGNVFRDGYLESYEKLRREYDRTAEAINRLD